MKEIQLVAFYVSKVNPLAQVQLYASYLEPILENEERKIALGYAEDNGLHVFAITKKIVENIRSKPHDVDACSALNVSNLN